MKKCRVCGAPVPAGRAKFCSQKHQRQYHDNTRYRQMEDKNSMLQDILRGRVV